MSFLSTVVLSALEKELVAVSPEVEQFILQEISVVAQQVISYVEKKIGIPSPSQA